MKYAECELDTSGDEAEDDGVGSVVLDRGLRELCGEKRHDSCRSDCNVLRGSKEYVDENTHEGRVKTVLVNKDGCIHKLNKLELL